MLPAESQYEENNAENLVESMWLKIQTFLENKKKLIEEEIVSYPTPIPTCDVQFNYLLEERARISQELSLVRQYITKSKKRNSMKSMCIFIRGSAYINGEHEQKLISVLKDVILERENQ